MALELIDMPVEEAKLYLYQKACKRVGRERMRPTRHFDNLERGFEYSESSGIITFYYNVIGEKKTYTEAARIKLG